MTDEAKPTERQIFALRHLNDHPGTWPAGMGYALAASSTAQRDNPGKRLNAQGAGRLGGTMLARLRKAGWAKYVSLHYKARGTFSNAHEITHAGRLVLKEAERLARENADV